MLGGELRALARARPPSMRISRPQRADPGYSAGMEWGFIWLMFALKIPIIALLCLVWWAIKQEVRPEEDRSDGGIGDRPRPRHPRVPRRRPRGPHGEPAPLPSPARVRTVRAKGRSVPRSSD